VNDRGPSFDPSFDYILPKTVGAAQIAYDAAWPRGNGMLDHFTTKELFDDMASHGLRAVRLWLSVPYDDGMRVNHNDCGDSWIADAYYEEMREVWEHPDIDVIVIIFVAENYSVWDIGCSGTPEISWAHEPTYEIAKFFFENFGDQKKTIIFTNPEIDNLWRGFTCFEPWQAMWDFWPDSRVDECLAMKTQEECAYDLSMTRMFYTKMKIERRAEAVQRARAEYPDATIRIGSAMTISATTRRAKYFYTTFMHSMYKHLTHQPEWIGLSHWKGDGTTLEEAVNNVMRLTGYPVERIFLDQFGMFEKYDGKQYNLIYNKGVEAFDLGINSLFVWIYRQPWHNFDDQGRPLNRGMFQWLTTEGRVEWGAPTSGLRAIQELNAEYGEE